MTAPLIDTETERAAAAAEAAANPPADITSADSAAKDVTEGAKLAGDGTAPHVR